MLIHVSVIHMLDVVGHCFKQNRGQEAGGGERVGERSDAGTSPETHVTASSGSPHERASTTLWRRCTPLFNLRFR